MVHQIVKINGSIYLFSLCNIKYKYIIYLIYIIKLLTQYKYFAKQNYQHCLSVHSNNFLLVIVNVLTKYLNFTPLPMLQLMPKH